MALSEIQLGPPGSFIPIYPDFDFEQILNLRSRQDLRTKEGTLYTYIEPGRFTEFSLPWSWVSSSDRSLVNSWFSAGVALQLVLNSQFPSSFHDVRIVGAEEPLQSFKEPYGPGDSSVDVFYEGRIALETT